MNFKVLVIRIARGYFKIPGQIKRFSSFKRFKQQWYGKLLSYYNTICSFDNVYRGCSLCN